MGDVGIVHALGIDQVVGDQEQLHTQLHSGQIFHQIVTHHQALLPLGTDHLQDLQEVTGLGLVKRQFSKVVISTKSAGSNLPRPPSPG